MGKMKFTFSNIAIITLLTLVFLLSISLKPVHADAGHITLKPTDDTYVALEHLNSNYGTQTILIAATGDIPRGQVFDDIVWLKFDLSSIPNGTVITNATLSLYALGDTTYFPINAHSCSNTSWSELTLTYSNKPTYNGTSMDTVIATAPYQWYNWSVVDAVRNAVSNNSAVTIVLNMNPFPPPATNYYDVSFESKEAPVNTTDYSPMLTVYWSDAVPEFPTFAILPIFMAVTLIAAVIYKRRAVVPKFV